jgi:hypothetical protein
MGEVFRAVAVGESGFEKPVVVKRILPAHLGRSDLAELFIAEARLMTRLAHPNIVEVLDFGRGESGDYFLVLELVDGVDLARLHRFFAARAERMPVALALYIAAQVLRGLHHAHARSGREGGWLVHRDVSPGNVLLSTAGEVKVADFGVALIARPADGERGARVSGLVGKPQYMAPEQYDGVDIDPRADLFSVGVLLFFLLTDAVPFEGATLAEQQDAAHRGDFGRARDQRAEVSPELDALLRRALAPSPRDRFPDARAMAQAIEALQGRGATGDDVAAAVEAAQRAQPAPGRRVIALSGSAPVEREDASLVEHELTRTGAAGGVGSFTIRVADAEPSPLVDASGDDPPAPPEEIPPPLLAPPEARLEEASAPPSLPLDRSPSPRRALTLAVGALVLAIAVGLGGRALLVASPAPATTVLDAPRIDPSAVPLVVPPTIVSAAPSPAPPPDTAARVVAPPRSPPPRASAAISAAPLAIASAAAPPSDCAGSVRIASTGSWTVRGGPEPVQSPGVYTWRCGTFALDAVSRADAEQRKRVSVTVLRGASALVDLR